MTGDDRDVETAREIGRLLRLTEAANRAAEALERLARAQAAVRHEGKPC